MYFTEEPEHIRQLRELPDEIRLVECLIRVEAEILQENGLSVAEVVDLCLDKRPHAVRCQWDSEDLCNRLQRELRSHLPLGPPQV